VIARLSGFGMAPDEMLFMKAHVHDVTSLPGQIDRSCQPVSAARSAHRIQPGPFGFFIVTQRHVQFLPLELILVQNQIRMFLGET
jgi:hypothetical protein